MACDLVPAPQFLQPPDVPRQFGRSLGRDEFWTGFFGINRIRGGLRWPTHSGMIRNNLSQLHLNFSKIIISITII